MRSKEGLCPAARPHDAVTFPPGFSRGAQRTTWSKLCLVSVLSSERPIDVPLEAAAFGEGMASALSASVGLRPRLCLGLRSFAPFGLPGLLRFKNWKTNDHRSANYVGLCHRRHMVNEHSYQLRFCLSKIAADYLFFETTSSVECQYLF